MLPVLGSCQKSYVTGQIVTQDNAGKPRSQYRSSAEGAQVGLATARRFSFEWARTSPQLFRHALPVPTVLLTLYGLQSQRNGSRGRSPVPLIARTLRRCRPRSCPIHLEQWRWPEHAFRHRAGRAWGCRSWPVHLSKRRRAFIPLVYWWRWTAMLGC